MKRKIIISLASIVGAAYLFVSCNKSDKDNNGSTSSLLDQGSWTVSRYVDNGNDETDHYKNYRFTFSDAGIISATNDSVTVNGTWNTTAEHNENKLVLYFGTTSFSGLSDDWSIVQSTTSTVILADADRTDSLIFKKI